MLKLLGAQNQLAPITTDRTTVTRGSLNGHSTLVLTAVTTTGRRPGYQEQLTVGAGNGIPLEFTGGDTGRTPEVTSYYTVSRVSISSIEGDTGVR